MDKHIGEQLTLFAEDSHVSPSQSQDYDKGRTMTVTSGLRCLELYENVSPAGSLARTFLGSSEWHSTMCALIWSAKATKSGRLYYQLVPSMLTTEETESGLWRTPMNSDWKNMDTVNQLHLSKQVKDPALWPTPTTRDYKGGRKAETLEAKGRLPTNSLPDLVNSQAGETGPLNPTPFVEWLMGFPTGWTELKP